MSTSPLETSTTPDQAAAVPFDAHGIEAIPDESRDCSPWELFWIWSGANIAPINWVLGALGITLGLSLVETLVVVVLGNVVGCAVFGVFNVIGHRTAVNQMVLGRAPFGLKGSIVPGVVQFLLTMGWVGVNTWVVLDLVLAVLAEFGITGGTWLEFAVASAIMAVQLGLALYGFYAIRSFEKYTVPATVLVMAVMTILALVNTDVNWASGSAVGPGREVHRDHPAAHGDRNRLGHHVDSVCLRLQPLRPGEGVLARSVLVLHARHVRPDRVAGRAGCMPGQRRQWQRPVRVGGEHIRGDGCTRAAAARARPDRDEHPEPVLLLAGRPVDRCPRRTLEDHPRGGTGRLGRVGGVRQSRQLCAARSTTGWSRSWSGSAHGLPSCSSITS